MITNGTATEVYRRGKLAVTVSGIPAVSICPRCNNAVIDWEIAQQVEDLVQPIFLWVNDHTLPEPTIAIVFPEQMLAGTD